MKNLEILDRLVFGMKSGYEVLGFFRGTTDDNKRYIISATNQDDDDVEYVFVDNVEWIAKLERVELDEDGKPFY